MPKLWSETVDGHRAAIRDATLDVTAALVAERGLSSVTMTEVANRAGIGRATLYKYFPDVDSILTAWHERQVGDHLRKLTEIRDQNADVTQQLEEVLTAFAFMTRQSQDGGIVALLHQGEHLVEAQQQLRVLIQGLITDSVGAGRIRDDVPTAELATYCLHAIRSASSAPSQASVHRLVAVILAGMSCG